MSAKHTPGKWRPCIYGGLDSPRVWSDAGPIALLQHHDSGPAEAEANARLIAAAPDLLAALQRLLSCDIEENRNITGSPGAIAAARASIKLATGEQT